MRMEIKICFVETIQNKGFKVTKQSKCRHSNAGYCRMNTKCVFYHWEEVCEMFITTECLEQNYVLIDIQKNASIWLGDPQSCLRGQECRYLHRIGNKGKKIRNANRNVDINNKVEKTKDSEHRDGSKKRKISHREDSDISNTLNQEEKDAANNNDKQTEKECRH